MPHPVPVTLNTTSAIISNDAPPNHIPTITSATNNPGPSPSSSNLSPGVNRIQSVTYVYRVPKPPPTLEDIPELLPAGSIAAPTNPKSAPFNYSERVDGAKVVAAVSVEQIVRLSHPDRGLAIYGTDIAFCHLVAKIDKILRNDSIAFIALLSDHTLGQVEVQFLHGVPTNSFENLSNYVPPNPADELPSISSPVISASSSTSSSMSGSKSLGDISSDSSRSDDEYFPSRGTGIEAYDDVSQMDAQNYNEEMKLTATTDDVEVVLETGTSKDSRGFLKVKKSLDDDDDVDEPPTKRIKSNPVPPLDKLRVNEYVSCFCKVLFKDSRSPYLRALRITLVSNTDEIRLHRLETVRDRLYYEHKRFNAPRSDSKIQCTHVFYDSILNCYREIYYFDGAKNYEDTWNSVPGKCRACLEGKNILRNVPQKSYARLLELELELTPCERTVMKFMQNLTYSYKKDVNIKYIITKIGGPWTRQQILEALTELEKQDICIRVGHKRWGSLLHEWN